MIESDLPQYWCEACNHPSSEHKAKSDPHPCSHQHCSCPDFAVPPGYLDALARDIERALGVAG